MKNILISTQPTWCELIASGKKTIEVRKTRPKLETPFKVHIYCTNSTDRILYFSCNDKVLRTTKSKYIHSIERTCKIFSGKVIGEFVCDSIITILFDSDIRYGQDFPNEYISKICNDSCLSLQELRRYANGKDVYGWHISDLVIYDEPKELSNFKVREINKVWSFTKKLKRPPQSWCYIEDMKGCENDG